MKIRFLLAIALLFSSITGSAVGAGSLAARVQAATAARQQQQAAVQAATREAAAAELAERATPVPQRVAPATSNGRLNVADWLNGDHDTGSDPRGVGASASSDTVPAGTTSSRRRSSPAVRGIAPSLSIGQRETPPLELIPQANEDASAAVAPVLKPVEHGALQLNQAEVHEPEGEATDEESTDVHIEVTDELAATTEDDESVEDIQPVEESEDEPVPEVSEPVVPKKQFSPGMIRLRDRIRYCLSYYYQRPESAAERSPWGVMHALISYGVDTELQAGRTRVNAIGWLCYNRPCRNMKLFQFDGKYPVPRNGPGYQGHEGQFLSMLALSRVKSTYPMRVDGHELTVQDLIEYEKYTCRPGTELTFKLIGLSHYLPSDATWTSRSGEQWDIPRLIKEELSQPINGACCGGTHRLIGYSMAVKARKKRGEPLDGQWLRAQKYVDSYHKYVIKLQNRDGSFSTSWLKKRDSAGDIDRRIQTTGHILEWLVFSLPENELTDPRVVQAVSFLVNSMISNRQKDWEIGPRGHALRALALYNERLFGDKPGDRRALLARRPRK